MKTPIPYYGSKGEMGPWICSLFPRHRVYVEPFAGSCAVLFAKAPAIHEVVNDIDGEVVNFFRVLRESPAELERLVRLTPYGRDEFRSAKLGAVDPLEQARRWWVRVNQSFNKSSRLENGFSSSVACQNGEAKTVQNRADRLSAAARRLIGVTIENRDALEVIAAYGVEDAVVYVDPPYLGETRGQDRAYCHEFSDESDHRGLAKVLHDSPATVVLSGYASELYDEMYADWWRIDVSVLRRSSNRASGARPRATEVLWSNSDLGSGRLFGVGAP